MNLVLKIDPEPSVMENHVRALLRFMGEDPGREGLVGTPDRVLRAWTEMTAGYRMDPAEILSRTFDVRSDEMVIVKGIQFFSTCEHHLLGFSGTAAVGYLPAGRVVGLSKIPRLVECFARRLQVQERMTEQIAGAMREHLETRGVAVVIEAKHSCMGCRGVKQGGASMITSSMLGSFRTDSGARSEFLGLTRT